MDLESGFESDLQSWLATVYERIELLARHQERVAVEGVLERENRLLTLLIVILAVSIVLLPVAGGHLMIGALALLYVGALGSSVVTLIKINRLEQSSARSRAIRERYDSAWRNRPAIGVGERALLIRVMNLSNLRASSSARAALTSELFEARSSPGLSAWPVLADAEVLLRDIPPPPEE